MQYFTHCKKKILFKFYPCSLVTEHVYVFVHNNTCCIIALLTQMIIKILCVWIQLFYAFYFVASHLVNNNPEFRVTTTRNSGWGNFDPEFWVVFLSRNSGLWCPFSGSENTDPQFRVVSTRKGSGPRGPGFRVRSDPFRVRSEPGFLECMMEMNPSKNLM